MSLNIDKRAFMDTSELVLSKYFGKKVEIREIQQLHPQDKTLRWIFETSVNGISSCIAQIYPWGPEHYSDRVSDDRQFKPFLLELAGLKFAAGINHPKIAFPKLYGYLPEFRCTLIEDFGSIDLAWDLHGAEPQQMTQWLLDLTEAIATEQILTLGRSEEFEGIFHGICQETGLGESLSSQHNNLATDPFYAACKELDIHISQKVTQEIKALIEKVENPGPYLAYGIQNIAVRNVFSRDGRFHFIDLKQARFKHMMIASIHYLAFFPMELGRIPFEVLQEMDAVYRKTLQTKFPMFADDATWEDMIAVTYGFWFLHHFPWDYQCFKPFDRPALGGTERQYALARIESFLEWTKGTKTYPALREAAVQAHDKLDKLWGNRHRPPYMPAYSLAGAR